MRLNWMVMTFSKHWASLMKQAKWTNVSHSGDFTDFEKLVHFSELVCIHSDKHDQRLQHVENLGQFVCMWTKSYSLRDGIFPLLTVSQLRQTCVKPLTP